MFGFLKDKLKQAVQKFSKSAEEEVKEEKVEDAKAIEQAKEEEKKILKQAKPAVKAPAKAVPAKAAPAKPTAPSKAAPKEANPASKPAPVQKEAPAKPVSVPKGVPKSPEKKPAAKAPVKMPVKTAPKPAPAKQAAPVKVEKVEERKAEKKPGFFGRLFGKKTEVVEEKVAEVIEEVREEITDAVQEQEIKEELAAAEAIQRDTETEIVQETIEEELAQADEAALHEAEAEFEEELEAEQPVVEETVAAEPAEAPEEKPSFFGKLKDAFTKKQLSDEKFEELFWELELAMLENNVAVEVIEKIKQDLKSELTSGKVSRLGVEDMIAARLRQSVEELFDVEPFDLITRIRAGPKPYKICIVGVNGSGKTTTLAKIVHLLQRNDLSVVVAASDTFRAAAIDQLREHTERLGVKLISQGYGADPAAVAFDAIKHAEAKGIDVVLIDTAGRLHSNTNLMAELEKVVRVAKPDLKIFVGESITGNDCVEQAKVFNELVGIDAIILSKADVDEKGGAAISVSYVTGKPILYLGTGQTYDDLEPFDKVKIIEAVGL